MATSRKPTLKVVPREGAVTPLHPGALVDFPKTTRLETIQDMRKDSVRLYRAMRRGQIDSGELSRIMFSVGKIADLMEKADVEPRMAALEARVETIVASLEHKTL